MFFAIRLELNEWFQEPTWRVYKGSLFSWVDQICQKRNCESYFLMAHFGLIQSEAPIVSLFCSDQQR